MNDRDKVQRTVLPIATRLIRALPAESISRTSRWSSALEPHRVRKGVSDHVRAGDQSRH
jgi:hypothetical protein